MPAQCVQVERGGRLSKLWVNDATHTSVLFWKPAWFTVEESTRVIFVAVDVPLLLFFSGPGDPLVRG